jgi:hypothetical protein
LTCMNILYERLPLPDLTAPRAVSRRSRSSQTDENRAIDLENARFILELIGIYGSVCLKNAFEAQEKYMVETQPEGTPSAVPGISLKQKGHRKPHYTHILAHNDNLVFQVACCLPLKIIAASLDGYPVSGRILFNTYSDEDGGKLVYEFTGDGREVVIDLKRGNSTRVQRLIFKGNA